MRRHLDGWPLGVVALVIALLGVALFLPRPARSFVLPAPEVDWLEARTLGATDGQRADSARRAQLPFDVRSVGEQIRRYGSSEAISEASAQDQQEVRRRTRVALQAHGAEPLLELRALQLELFLVAVERFRSTGSADAELVELGGDFARRAEVRRWLTPTGAGARSLHELELATLFRTRWVELTGLGAEPAFRLTLNEWRIYYGFLLRELEPDAEHAELGLRYLEALARRDGAYPVDLARGVLYLRQQAYPLAVTVLQRHLELTPHGAWTLRARNYLAQALLAAGAENE